MAGRLTVPFAPGADQLWPTMQPGASPDELRVAGYDFREHQARFDRTPEVTYVLYAVEPAPSGAEVSVVFADPGFGADVVVPVPVPPGARIDAGDSFAVPLPAGATAQTRVIAVREEVNGAPTPVPVLGRWSLAALLGTTARLLWVIGAERDCLSRQRDLIRHQRSVQTATGSGLDLLGADLGVPRFPPTPCSVDAGTIVLYHLDDVPGAAPAVRDSAAAFPGRTPHHGALAGPAGAVVLGGPGRYDGAAAFVGPGSITVAGHPDLDLPAVGALTVECFLRPAPGSALGAVLALGAAAGPGWSIEVGDIGLGVPRAVRASIADGATSVVAASAVNLPTDRFSHVAATLTRGPTGSTWALHVNGTLVATADATVLGAIAGAGDLVIGPGAGDFRGAVDEVRVSGVARAGFHPMLGEADEQYRRRLGLFRRWVLPTPRGLQDVLNALVPEIDGVAEPFVVDDADGATAAGRRLVRVWPRTVEVRDSIASDGRRGVSEADLWPREAGLDPALLGRHAHPQVTYLPPGPEPGRDPALPAPDPHVMQPLPAAALDRLAGLVAAQGLAGMLVVTSGFDPAAADSRADGRAVLLRLTALGPARLAALAHRAGFDLVEHRDGRTVYAACRPGTPMLVGPAGSGGQLLAGELPMMTVGDTATITLAQPSPTYTPPTLPVDAEVRHQMIPAWAGRGTLAVATPTPTTAALTAVAPGALALTADIARAGRVMTVSGVVRIVPAPLPSGASIAADGTLGVDLTGLGPAEQDFDPAFLALVNDPRIDVAAGPDTRRMQRGCARRLIALADRLQAGGVPGRIRLVSAYQPAAPPTALESRGRRLVIGHTQLAIGELAVEAHLAGFGYVARTGATVVVAEPASDPVGISGPAEVEVGAMITLTVSPSPGEVSARTRLGWSSGQVVATVPEETGVVLTSTADPDATVVGAAPGQAWVQATLRDVDAAGPYAVTVRLRPELAAARISRDDYYLLMNALKTLHPVGVEVRTEAIRSAVVELADTPDGIDPSFTYPAFRLHRAAAASRRRTTDDG